jgi:hypothetical protein
MHACMRLRETSYYEKFQEQRTVTHAARLDFTNTPRYIQHVHGGVSSEKIIYMPLILYDNNVYCTLARAFAYELNAITE